MKKIVGFWRNRKFYDSHPNVRTLLHLRSKIPKQAGCDPSAYKVLRQLLDQLTNTREGRDVLFVWDTMDYDADIHCDKKSGQLLGFEDDFQFGLCV